MAKSSFLQGHTLRCTVHFVPSYNKNKKVISILHNRIRGAYSRYQEFPFLPVSNFVILMQQTARTYLLLAQKKFSKLRDIGLFKLNVCSKILRYSYQKIRSFLKTDRVNNKGDVMLSAEIMLSINSFYTFN